MEAWRTAVLQEEYGLDRPVRHARIDGGGAKRYIFTGIASLGLFLLPFGRPSGFTSVIHFGGLPRRFPCPRESRSSTRIASEIRGPLRIQQPLRMRLEKP
jgi:hypothetical protein